MQRDNFKTKLSKDEFKVLADMLLNFDLLLIADYDVREMTMLIMTQVLRRMSNTMVKFHYTNHGIKVSLKLKQGEAATMRYVLAHFETVGHGEVIREALLYSLHKYFGQ
jgi:hypothetical protein